MSFADRRKMYKSLRLSKWSRYDALMWAHDAQKEVT